jgi:hypothetical protein
MSPKYFHAKSTLQLVRILDRWSEGKGLLGIEWAIDLRDDFTSAQSLTVFYPDAAPINYTGAQLISDPIFPELSISVSQLF